MPASTVELPNIRKIFRPDPGFTIYDCDLDRADLQVVVWEADDADLKRQLRLGVDIHIINGILLEGLSPPPEDELIEGHPNYPEHKARFKKPRVLAKAFCHGTNYGGGARTMAAVINRPVHATQKLQDRWFAIHPGILEWHRRTTMHLQTRRYVENAFGYRRFYFDRIEALLPEALAWVPQSTVAVITNLGMIRIEDTVPEAEILLQVHDSVVFQLPTHIAHSRLPAVREAMMIEVPYPEPLTIPVGFKGSVKSWGDCKEVHI